MAAILLPDGNDTDNDISASGHGLHKQKGFPSSSLVNLHIKCDTMAKPFLANSSRLLGCVLLWLGYLGYYPLSLLTINFGI